MEVRARVAELREPSFLYPTARWWFELPDVSGLPAGPALSPALLVEEAEHGVTTDVAWAYAQAIPELLGEHATTDLLPLAFGCGALRAAALKTPVELDGLVHVQTGSPEVCRHMGARVSSFAVRGEECVEALLEHGTAVREVVATHCVPFDVEAPFRLVFPRAVDLAATRWFEWILAEHFMPIVRLDLDVWLCWDRDLARACVVNGHDTVVDGRWGPRDVAPEADPPPWAEPETRRIGGERWATTMIHNHRRGGASMLADGARGWCRLHVDAENAYHEALRSAWHEGRSLREVKGMQSESATLAALRFERSTARFEWLGFERVLRARDGDVEQLTRDHDLRYDAAHGGSLASPELLAQLTELPDVVTRALPAHAPSEGTCNVAPGDRFLLIDDRSQRALERAAGGRGAFAKRVGDGSPRQVARWMRHVLMDAYQEQPVVIVDADAKVTSSPASPRAASPAEPTARDLIERPAEFHGRRVRFRGVYRHAPELRVIADAWFEGESALPWGTWIVEAEGEWIHDGGEHGHMGGYASELRGTLTEVDLSRARSIAPDRVRFARRYVPLSSDIVIERGLLHWTHEGRRVTRLGRDARLPVTDLPDRCHVRATFCVCACGHVGLLDWEISRTEPLAPMRATADAPGEPGRYVEIEGLLVPTDRYPRLDGVLDVSPPSHTRSDRRYTIPDAEAVLRYHSVLGSGRRVTIHGEVGESSLLRALSIMDDNGQFEL